jgi:hypothetical protein
VRESERFSRSSVSLGRVRSELGALLSRSERGTGLQQGRCRGQSGRSREETRGFSRGTQESWVVWGGEWWTLVSRNGRGSWLQKGTVSNPWFSRGALSHFVRGSNGIQRVGPGSGRLHPTPIVERGVRRQAGWNGIGLSERNRILLSRISCWNLNYWVRWLNRMRDS